MGEQTQENSNKRFNKLKEIYNQYDLLSCDVIKGAKD